MHGKAVFLDLNGTLVLPIKPDRLAEIAPIPAVAGAVAQLTRAGFQCPVVTVQSGIAKGRFTSDEFVAWFRNLAADFRLAGAELAGPYICPHRFAEPCACKKPNTVLYEQAAADLGVSVTRSFVVGDSPDDVRAATRLGARSCLVRTGRAADSAVLASIAAEATYVANSLVDAASWILADHGRC